MGLEQKSYTKQFNLLLQLQKFTDSNKQLNNNNYGNIKIMLTNE